MLVLFFINPFGLLYDISIFLIRSEVYFLLIVYGCLMNESLDGKWEVIVAKIEDEEVQCISVACHLVCEVHCVQELKSVAL